MQEKIQLNTKNEIKKEQKKELRTKVKKKISKLSRRETEESDKKILHQIKSLAEYKNADTIFCYVSTEKEINTISLLQEILDSTGTKDLEDAFFELYRSRKGEA